MLDCSGYGTVPWPETKEQGNDDTGTNTDTSKCQQNPARMHSITPLRQGGLLRLPSGLIRCRVMRCSPGSHLPQRVEVDLKRQVAWECRLLQRKEFRHIWAPYLRLLPSVHPHAGWVETGSVSDLNACKSLTSSTPGANTAQFYAGSSSSNSQLSRSSNSSVSLSA